ncbi:sigma-70 family RNA polymerase sigma factor [Cellulomonas sp. 73-92]|uniref:sigma-70 family RNA polymerase sigma factor n=1 Tax=Cellulomonas sp. 73-92 TaxID=1895740 RepID=UPI000B0A3C5C|nr:sigma-70 family RNA polymerase sigma factor [Cellulomonas sp. 73-92]
MDDDRLHAVPDAAPGASATGGPAADLLLAQVGRGDGAAFDRLYPLVAGPVYGLALRVVRNPALAEEVSQEVLVDVWRQAPRFDRTRGSAMAWVLTMAHRRAVDRVRREETLARATRAAALAVPDEEPRDVVVDEAERTWDAARVRHAMAGLTGLQRDAIELAFFSGYTHQQVASVLGVPLGTAKTRIRDGLIRLRDTLGVEPS